ncbi:MAG: molecular chaperone TorD family protein [Anderseniella sp.]
MQAQERSAVYAGFAAAFRSADGGKDLLDEALVPLASDDGSKSFVEAFDPSVSKAAVSLHASSHLEREQTDLYQELIRWYSHFGLKRRDGGELPDHLSVMLEFMQFLCAQESANQTDHIAVAGIHAAQRDFITRHLLPLVETVVEKSTTKEPRYRELPRALGAFLLDEITHLT